MAKEDLDALLERMDDISRAVNSFSSESVQKEAFAALISQFRGSPVSNGVADNIHPEKTAEPTSVKPSASDAPKASKPKKASRNSRAEWKMVKDLDLRPSNKQSFDEFVSEKRPTSNEDKYVVALYYLSAVLEISPVTIDHIGSVFRITKSWKEPTDVAAGLRVAASRKSTLDSKDYEDLKLTPHGRNFVEHDLPQREKTAK